MPYLKRINNLPLINHISYKYAQVSDIGPSWSSCLTRRTYEPCFMKKRLNVSAKTYQLWAACVGPAVRPGSNFLTLVRFSACQKIFVTHNTVGCWTKMDFMDL